MLLSEKVIYIPKKQCVRQTNMTETYETEIILFKLELIWSNKAD